MLKRHFKNIKLKYKSTLVKVVTIAMFVLVGMTCFAQTANELYIEQELEARVVDTAKWNSLTKEIDFEKNRKDKKSEKDKNDGLTDEERAQAQREFEENLGAILKFVVIFLVIGIIIFLMVKLMDAENIFNPRNRKIKANTGEINLEKIEENLHETDVKDFIVKAIEDGDYNLAIRLYYLAILKNLSLENQIKWKKDKTNGEYLREMRGASLYEKFREVTLIFERLWYGNVKIDQLAFMDVEPKFKAFLTQSTKTND